MKKLLLLLALTLLAAGLAGCGNSSGNVAVPEKPVLYLYPEEETEVTVTLDFDGTLTSTYPDYGDGWTVTARPGGTLTDPATGREYYCLFWEGITDAEYDFSTGFCVAGEDTAAFLEDALDRLGLTEREADEFIIYWLPKLEGNPYNLLSFQTEAYTDSAGLTIDPAPDTLIRVFLAWEGLDAPVEVAPRALVSIPTGIAIALPSAEYVALVFARSGLGIKHGIALSNGVGVIDSDYRGEIRVGLTNLSDTPYTVQPGDRIAQLAVMPVVQAELERVDSLDDTGRGTGGFGSTGK